MTVDIMDGGNEMKDDNHNGNSNIIFFGYSHSENPEVFKEQDEEEKQQGIPLVCFRCGQNIDPAEEMISIDVILMKQNNGEFDCSRSQSISQLCLSCASLILAEAVIKRRLTAPDSMQDETGKEEIV